jgi:hypothetical protein
MLRLSARLLLQRNRLGDALLRATEAAACDHSVQSHALVALVQPAAGNTRGAQAAVRAITAALPPSDVADALQALRAFLPRDLSAAADLD